MIAVGLKGVQLYTFRVVNERRSKKVELIMFLGLNTLPDE